MSLAGGTKHGPYEILSLLGAGGMGEGYKAEDKVSFAAGASRVNI